ncbi:MAG: hypothetical protein Ct9H300mP28_07320 [Pseudomonadota bacterium]|nr:MAG: hypothetical protein Ct9H300mP28_07320 [Pseudomonadota bacterium]
MQGEKVYRLLDCTLTFLDNMPREGKPYAMKYPLIPLPGTIRTFYFSSIMSVLWENKMVFRMDNGCAGFFSDDDLAQAKV